MAEVKWIKISTDIFTNEKLLLIEDLFEPKTEADSIIIIWFKLLCLAGKQNNSGVFTIGNKMPYTPKMLSSVLKREEATIKTALEIFEQFGMIEIIGGVITIPNWEKHQSIDKLEEIRKQTRSRVAKHREKQKHLSCNVTVTEDVTLRNATDKIRKEEKREEENRKDLFIADEPKKHTFGKYKNVLLSDDELETLKNDFPVDFDERIDKLSIYMESTGKSYDNHLATMQLWAKNDNEQQKNNSINQSSGNPFLDLAKEKGLI